MYKRKIGVNPCNLGLDSGFLDMKPKGQTTKEKNSHLGFIIWKALLLQVIPSRQQKAHRMRENISKSYI